MGNEQSLLKLEKALKEIYLPTWENMLCTKPSALLAKIGKKPLETGGIVKAIAPMGLSGGFGSSKEGMATPISGGMRFQDFQIKAVDMYANIEITNKAVTLASGGGSMINALDAEIKGAYETADWNVGRMLFGNGTGILANTIAMASAGNSVVVSDTKFLKEGLIVDFYATGAIVGSTPAFAERRILFIDRASKTVTFDGSPCQIAEGFLTVQKSYGNEMTGIGAIFDDSITTLYGVDKSKNNIIKPLVFDAQKDLTDSILTKALRSSQNEKNGKVDMLIFGDEAYDAYVEYLRLNNTRVESNLTLAGGFKAISFQHDNREVAIVNDRFIPNDEIWGVDTRGIDLKQSSWTFMQRDSGIFTLVPGTAVYRAALANYGNLINNNPGSSIRITNAGAVI